VTSQGGLSFKWSYIYTNVPPILLSAVTAAERNGISAEVLSKIWRIPIEQATRTLLDMTTQLDKQDADSSLSRIFGTNDCMIRYKRIKSLFYTDTFDVTGKAKSTRGTCVSNCLCLTRVLSGYTR